MKISCGLFEVKLYSKYYNTCYINLYTEPGIEATACARELLYVYVYVYVEFAQTQFAKF